jgi:hypothetical protein
MHGLSRGRRHDMRDVRAPRHDGSRRPCLVRTTLQHCPLAGDDTAYRRLLVVLPVDVRLSGKHAVRKHGGDRGRGGRRGGVDGLCTRRVRLNEADGRITNEEVADERVRARGVDHRCLVTGAVEDAERPVALLPDGARKRPAVVEPARVRRDGEALDAAERGVLNGSISGRRRRGGQARVLGSRLNTQAISKPCCYWKTSKSHLRC